MCECINEHMGYFILGGSISIFSFCMTVVLIHNLFNTAEENKKTYVPKGIEIVKTPNVEKNPNILEEYVMTIGEIINKKIDEDGVSINKTSI